MLTRKYPVLIVYIFILCVFVTAPALAETKQVSGWIEKVAVIDQTFVLPAKIDTGAKNSSIHAENYKIYSKQGADWVRFTVNTINNESKDIDQPIKRYAQIKQKGNRPSRQRPVIVLGVCLGNVLKEVEVTLADRGNFNYPMLVGRSFLSGSFVVDSGEKFLTTPQCNF